MRKISIGFSKPKDKKLPLFSWAIRAYEKTPYSHVYIRWQTHWGAWICYHAASVMVHFLGEEAFNKKITIVEEFEFSVSDEQFDKLMQFCIKYAGADYGLRDVLRIPLWDLGLRPASSDDPWKQYCAELVMRAFGEMEGKKLTQDEDRVKLKQVYQLVKEKYSSGAVL